MLMAYVMTEVQMKLRVLNFLCKWKHLKVMQAIIKY